MPFLTRKALILAKIETTYGTDPTPAPATDAVLVYDLSLRPDPSILSRQTLDSSLSRRPHVVGRKLFNIEFKVELKGSGVVDTPPDWGPLLRACGMAQAITASTRVRYTPVSSAFESVTIYAYWDGLLTKLTGCFGDVELVTPAGQFGYFLFRMRGIYNAPTDAAIPGGAVFDTTKPPMIQSAALTLGAYSTGVIESLQLRWGAQISERPDMNSAEGFKGLEFTGREITGSINPEAVTEATHAFWANFAAGTEVALSATFGSVAGNRIKINTAPKVQYGAPTFGDRNSIRIYDLPIFVNRNADAGNDEIVIDHD